MAKGASWTESLKITAHSAHCTVQFLLWNDLFTCISIISIPIQCAQQPKNPCLPFRKSFIYPVIASPSTITIKYTAVRKENLLFHIVGLVWYFLVPLPFPYHFVLLFSLDPTFTGVFQLDDDDGCYMCKTTYYKRSLVDGMEEGIVYDILLSMDTDMGGNHSLGYILALWLIWEKNLRSYEN